MSTSAEQALDLKPGARGRKGRDGTEETIKIKPIKDAVAELMTLYKKQQAATAAANEGFKKVAERSNCNTADLKQLIRASAAGTFEDTRRHIEQQQVLFESVGEVAGGKESDEK